MGLHNNMMQEFFLCLDVTVDGNQDHQKTPASDCSVDNWGHITNDSIFFADVPYEMLHVILEPQRLQTFGTIIRKIQLKMVDAVVVEVVGKTGHLRNSAAHSEPCYRTFGVIFTGPCGVITGNLKSYHDLIISRD